MVGSRDSSIPPSRAESEGLFVELRVEVRVRISHNSHSFTRVWPSCRSNFGRGRRVPAPVGEKGGKVLVHRSVKIRMEAEGLPEGKYEPKAKFQDFDYEWVY